MIGNLGLLHLLQEYMSTYLWYFDFMPKWCYKLLCNKCMQDSCLIETGFAAKSKKLEYIYDGLAQMK